MRVLLAGATGMIGQALLHRLRAAGHEVVLGVRGVEAAQRQWPGAPVVELDFSDPGQSRDWPALLAGIDAVINAVGIFREQGSQTFDALHVKGPGALFEAAADAGVERIIQLSALGAEPGNEAAYLASKGRADAALLELDITATVVQPSLVFAPQGPSTRWFALLAALPVTPLPGGGKQRIQPVHLDDLVDAIVRLLDSESPPRRLHAVGERALTLREYLDCFKQALGFARGFVPVPLRWTRAMARLLALRRDSLVTPEALRMLEAGNTVDPDAFAAVLGRRPLQAPAFFDGLPRGMMRRTAQLGWLVPLLRHAVAIMWVVTGVVSAFVFPVESSLDLLARTGLVGVPALLALYGAAALDVALGVGLWVTSRRRWIYRLQLALIVFYTVVITLCLPEYWAHPYGPVLKNLPLLAAIAVLHELDDGEGT
ncbi:DoxX-like family protein [Lysobacter sp. F60174L2]|uniref:DoxX-like family protein n=1 Tax=Lysobacter sp. F60174L2 TaxID=3459295 RepID=UPI00403E0A2E